MAISGLSLPRFLIPRFSLPRFSFPRLSLLPRLPKNALQNPKIFFQVPTLRIITTSLVINILSLALPILTLQVYDRLLIAQNPGTLQVLALGLAVVIILDVILRLCRSYITSWTGTVYEHSLFCNSMRHILASDLVRLHKEGVGSHLQRMGGIGKLREFVSGTALVTLIDLPFVFVFLSLITWLSGWLVLVPITLLLIFITLSSVLGKRLKKSLEHREETDRDRLDCIMESLEGIHSLKSMALETFFQRRYESIQKNTSEANLNLGRLNAEAVMMGTIFAQIMMVSIIAVGTPMALDGAITMGTLIACVMLSARITQPVQKGLGLWTRYQDYRLAHEGIEKTFSLPVLKRCSPDELSENGGRMALKDVSFSYDNSDVLFDDVNISLKRGEAINIAGVRGSGKTTLLKLMAGLYSPGQGEIYIDDCVATVYPARELVQHVGFLPMEGMIFRGTIWENLSAFGEYAPEKVHEMIRLLDLETAIKELPGGFDTKLEAGQSDPLPPGLRQRIAIARALVPKPRVILFDNADRALDRHGYNVVYRLLARLKNKATLVLVSDDRNIARLANREYVIEDRKIFERRENTDNTNDILPYQELRL